MPNSDTYMHWPLTDAKDVIVSVVHKIVITMLELMENAWT